VGRKDGQPTTRRRVSWSSRALPTATRFVAPRGRRPSRRPPPRELASAREPPDTHTARETTAGPRGCGSLDEQPSSRAEGRKNKPQRPLVARFSRARAPPPNARNRCPNALRLGSRLGAARRRDDDSLGLNELLDEPVVVVADAAGGRGVDPGRALGRGRDCGVVVEQPEVQLVLLGRAPLGVPEV